MKKIILFIVFCASFGISQNPFAITIDKSQGLPSNSVYDVFQDRKGFMWFATGKGLCRYDGYQFKVFTADFQTSKSGSCIAEDSYGRIWYSNFDGFLYYVDKGALHALPQQKSIGYYKFGILKNELFLVQANAILVYDLKTLKIKFKHKIRDKQIRTCIATSDKFYVLGDFFYELGSHNRIRKYPLPSDFYTSIVTPILGTWNDKIMLISKYNSTYFIFDKGTFSSKKIKKTILFTQNISVTNDFIWICTPNGVYRKNLKNEEIHSYFHNQNISSVYKDRHQNYWISTLNQGLLFVENFSNNYLALKPSPTAFSEDNKGIYIGAEKDLVYKLNYSDLTARTIHESESNHAVNQIYADTLSGHVFFSSFKFNTLNKYNQITNEHSIAVKDVKRIDEKFFSFAASGLSGIFCVDSNRKSKWDALYYKNKNKKSPNFNESILLFDSNGKSTEFNPKNQTIYYATNNGLMAVMQDGSTREIRHKNQTLYLTRIQRYKNQLIGLSTSEKLYVISDKNNVSALRLPNFIKNEKFHRFFIQKQFCYLFASHGVYEYDLNANSVQKVLSLNNDLESTDVILRDNRLYFATSKGILIKNRAEIGNYSPPKLILNEIRINGKRREINDIKQLNPDQNDLTIYFSTLASLPNENYSISYKINDNPWKVMDADSKNLKLSALASGSYTIRMAINYNDQKIDIQRIDFTIQKHFWQSLPFLLFMIVLTLVLFYLFYKVQINKVKKQNQILLEKNELEKNLNLSTLKAIKSQMNPHFFYNALNTIQSFILANDKKQAVNYLSKFSSLTRNILEMTEKEFITIAEEITTLRLYLDIEKARFDDDFDYFIAVEPGAEIEQEKIPAMLLQPFIENAVKHGLLHKSGQKKLELKFSKSEYKIRITIDDNGIGRQKSAELNAIKNKKHVSFATNAMQNRVDLLNQNKTHKITITFIDKQNQSRQSMGTTVVIEIPLNLY